jgi:DNA primase
MGEKDPDSLVQKHGIDRFFEILGNAADIFTFALNEWGGDASQMTGREKSEKVEAFVPLLSAVSDPVVRNDAAQRIADAFRLEFETVWSRVRGKAQAAVIERQPVRPVPSGEKFLLTAIVQGRVAGEALEGIDAQFFVDPACKTLFSIIKSELLTGQPIDFSRIATQLRGEAELTLLSEVTLSDDLEDAAVARIDEILIPMRKSFVDRRSRDIQRELVEAEQSGDEERIARLWIERRDLQRMSSTLK